MDFLVFLPPVFSIYLILTSLFPKQYLLKRVKNFTENKEHLKEHEMVIGFVALSWAATLNFFNTMIMAIISLYSIWSTTKNTQYIILAVIILLFIFCPMFWWIMSHEPDELASRVTRRWHISYDTICSVILILVNSIFIIVLSLI